MGSGVVRRFMSVEDMERRSRVNDVVSEGLRRSVDVACIEGDYGRARRLMVELNEAEAQQFVDDLELMEAYG